MTEELQKNDSMESAVIVCPQ